MKKVYEAPKAEKVEFKYEEAVVASGTSICNGSSTQTTTWTSGPDSDGCTTTTTDPYDVTQTDNPS